MTRIEYGNGNFIQWEIRDCIDGMREMEDNSVDLIITSPPYNVGVDYGDDFNDEKSFKQYIDWLNVCFGIFHRKLKDGGRLAINIGDHGRNPCTQTHAYIGVALHQLGLVCRGMIIWDKRNCLSNTAWGRWCSPSNPALRSRSEYIWVFNKGSMKKRNVKGKTIQPHEFITYTMETWEISPETVMREHPAPFPIEIPMRLIKLYTIENDLVLDPFLGSGTTLRACRMTNRNGIGFELNPDYDEIIRKRVRAKDRSIEQFF